MNRRRFLQAAAFPHILRSAAQRPNIVFLFADDLGRYAGVYRDPTRPGLNDVVRTPSFDRLAREGVHFTNAFMATPSCTPSRAAVATGCYSFRCGAAANLRGGDWTRYPDPGRQLPGFGQLLEQSGYLVRSSYKTLQRHWLGGKSYSNALQGYHRFSLYVSEAATRAEQERRREDVRRQTREGLRAALSERRAAQPFFYAFGPVNTHRPWVRGSGRKLWGIDPDALQGKLPAFLPDNEVVREDLADYLGEVQAVDMMAGCLMEELARAGQLDNTLFVLAGDNGIPGIPRGKCNLYDLGVRAPLIIRWPGKAAAGGRVDDFVNLMDLAPTFLEAGGVPRPASMNGRSLVPLLESHRNGLVDASRDFVVTSRERHVSYARQGNLPYPSRAVRTKDFLYIRNFKPDRSPMGDPTGRDEKMSFEELAATHELLTYVDMDASPTKAWILKNKDTEAGRRFFEIAFAKRPAEELYDLGKDPDQMHNVAGDSAYARRKADLSARLEKVMREAQDPRLEDAFDRPPYVESNPEGPPPERKTRRKR